MTSDFTVRASYTRAIRDLFLSRPYVWIDVRTLAQVGGFAGWRTRCSEVRQQLEGEGLGTIAWNQQSRDSQYRYVPVVPVETPAQQMTLTL